MRRLVSSGGDGPKVCYVDLDRSSPAAREWANDAIRRVEADANRSADTHLIPFPLTGPFVSCDIDQPSLQQLLSCGLDPQQFRVFVAKGVNAPLGAYRPVVTRFIRCNTPGPTCADMTQLPFHRRPRPLFPFEELNA